MKTYRLSICCVLLIVLGCSKNDDDNQKQQTFEQPDIPEPITYDLNGDSFDDFTIDYAEGIWDGVGASGGFFSAQFKPLGENRILEEYEENVSTSFLFAQMGDSIQRQATYPQSWTYLGWFASLYQGGDGIWSKEWLIESKKNSSPYYVGVGIWEEDKFLIGWLKLEIDKETGKIAVVDHELSGNDFVLIDR